MSTKLGAIGQIALAVRDVARAEQFYGEVLGPPQESLTARDVHFIGSPHVIYTVEATGIEEWMTFFEDGEGNTLALMSRVPPG